MLMKDDFNSRSASRNFFSNMARSGHNSAGRKSMYAIILDLDNASLQQVYPTPPYNNAYADIRKFLTFRGFKWVQGSGYFGDHTVDAVKCVLTIQKLNRKFSWFKAAVRDIRMLRIEENNDLLPTIMEEGEDE